MPDSYENEVDNYCLDPGINDAAQDPDEDGYLNYYEWLYKDTYPLEPLKPCLFNPFNDIDGDQMPDVWEYDHTCLNPELPDANGDADGDLIQNIMEYLQLTDPCPAGDITLTLEGPATPLNPGQRVLR